MVRYEMDKYSTIVISDGTVRCKLVNKRSEERFWASTLDFRGRFGSTSF